MLSYKTFPSCVFYNAIENVGQSPFTAKIKIKIKKLKKNN